MLDLTLFRNRVFTLSAMTSVFNYMAIYSLIFLMPFYLIEGRGFDPTYAGILLSVQSVFMAITAPVSGYASDKIGSRVPGMIGLGAMSIGFLLLSIIDQTTGLWVIVLGIAIIGFGTGSFISPNTSALMGSAPISQRGVASAMQAEARSFGMVLGIGMAGAIFTTQLAANTPQALYEGVNKGFLAAACGCRPGCDHFLFQREVDSISAPPQEPGKHLQGLSPLWYKPHFPKAVL